MWLEGVAEGVAWGVAGGAWLVLVVVCVAWTCVMARIFLCQRFLRHRYCQGVIRSAIFLGLSRGFWYFWSKTKKPREKKTRKRNCKTHVGTSWWVRVCYFLFFGFSRFLLPSVKTKKPREEQRKQKNKLSTVITLDGSLDLIYFMFQFMNFFAFDWFDLFAFFVIT